MKDFIKNKIREHLLNEMFNLNPAELNTLIKIGLDSSFENSGRAKKYIIKTVDDLNKLPETITLYRVVFANKKEDIDVNNIGDHFVLNRRQLEQNHHLISHVGGGHPFMLTVKTPKNLIDIQSTLKNKVMYPHENEITLLNKGNGAKVTRIEDFAPEDDFDFDLDY